jgi:hypothetical protein
MVSTLVSGWSWKIRIFLSKDQTRSWGLYREHVIEVKEECKM